MTREIAVLTFFGFVAAALGAVGVHIRHLRNQRTRASVWANLDNAYENGYFEPGEHCDRMTATELTQDLLLYSADFHPVTDIEPHVRTWMQSKGLDR